MLNFYVVQKRFEEHIYDILKYEISYYKDDLVIEHLVERFNEYLNLFWDKYKIKWNVTKPNLSSCVDIKIQFEEDPPFGFEFCIDLELLRNQRFIL